jgi:hypothetical protein
VNDAAEEELTTYIFIHVEFSVAVVEQPVYDALFDRVFHLLAGRSRTR